MITQLSIQNFAIIRQSDLHFSPHLTVITGETGAGKSILLGALQLLLGARADAGQLFDPTQKCVIEGHFQLSEPAVTTFLLEEDFDNSQDDIVLRRELLPNGKSRAFINDTPASVQQLRTLGNLLVDISAQHDTLELNTQKFQVDFLDAMAGQTAVSNAYSTDFEQLKRLLGEIAQLQAEKLERQKEADYQQFLYQELELAQLSDAEELEQLEQEYNLLQNAAAIGQLLQQLTFGLTEAENAPDTALGGLLAAASSYRKLDPRLGELFDRLQQTRTELQDLAREAIHLQDGFQADGGRLQLLESRLNELNRLLQKHRVLQLSDLIRLKNEIAAGLDAGASADQQLETLHQTATALETALQLRAASLSEARSKAIPGLEKAVQSLLPEMGMEHAHFKIELQRLTVLTGGRYGYDQIRFLFSANQGSSLQEIHKVASGGELSRLMLAIKSLLHDRLALPTVVFDEIDTGISGETSIRIARVLKTLAERHQVILVTHQPQIAAKGDLHLFVSKQNQQGKTESNIRVLVQEDRIEELAKMIGGAHPSDIAREHARELFHI